jgi:hypothetical protein
VAVWADDAEVMLTNATTNALANVRSRVLVITEPPFG